MIRHREFLMFLFISFTIVYALFGDRDVPAWSFGYFVCNYMIMTSLFIKEKNKTNRVVGLSFCVSMFVLIILRCFFDFNNDGAYSLITFIIALFWIYKKETP